MPSRSRNNPEQGELFVDARPISWVRSGGLRNRPFCILGHGAGAPYTSEFMQAVASGLKERGVTVVCFHFPYMERSVREGRRMPPDRAPILLATCRAMFDLVLSWLPAAKRSNPPIVVGGKSMGGRMMSMLLAGDDPAPAAGALYLGYPLHPPGRPEKLRAAHLESIRAPQLFLSGSKDSLARIEILRSVVKKLGKMAQLSIVEGGDHSLATSRRTPRAGSEVWLDQAADFIHRVTAQ